MRLTYSGVFLLLLVATYPFAASGQTRGYRFSQETQTSINELRASAVSNFPIPVLLGVEVNDLTKNFGDPRGDGTRTHEGLDILAPSGTPIASPVDAVVTSIGNGSSSGIYVRAAAPGGETLVYMHLSAIATGVVSGTKLKRGDILGFVGNTGNASGGPAHLHFEVRANRTPTDPYPRLTQTFTLAERMLGITQAIDKGGAAYIPTWASKFRNTFVSAQAQGIMVPQSIVQLLGTTPQTPPAQATSTAPHDPALVFGESNGKVITLQKFLISSNSGVAAAYLKNSGATGYFGVITKTALIEYQLATKIPATGTVDDETYLHIFGLDNEGDSTETEDDTDVVPATTTPAVFTRDLELKMHGEDVRALQVYLNAHGFVVAETGDGSPGKETDYFGARTQAALIRYQKAKAITPAAGYFGPKTRASFLR